MSRENSIVLQATPTSDMGIPHPHVPSVSRSAKKQPSVAHYTERPRQFDKYEKRGWDLIDQKRSQPAV